MFTELKMNSEHLILTDSLVTSGIACTGVPGKEGRQYAWSRIILVHG